MEELTVKTTDLQPITEDLFSRWEEYLDASPRTVATYTRGLKSFSLFLRERGITQPQREDVIAYRDSLRENHKPTTIQTYLASVKLFFQWTEQEGIYPNVAQHIKGTKIDTSIHKRDYLTSGQAGSLLGGIDRSTLSGMRDYALISIMLTTGLRCTSVATADVGDLKTAGDAVALYYQGKGRDGKEEYVKLASPVEEAIRSYLSARGKTSSSDPLFASVAHRNSGERMTTRSISRVVKEHMVEVGLDSDRLCAHSLRHTAATLNLLNGGSIEETQQLLGHRSINTTLIYSHALERASNNSEERVAQAIFG